MLQSLLAIKLKLLNIGKTRNLDVQLGETYNKTEQIKITQ